MNARFEPGNDRRVFMTGATGFIGTRTAQLMSGLGYKLVCIVRPTSDRSNLPENVELVEGHLLDKESLERAVQGCWAVIHIAGAVKARQVRDFYTINRDGTRNLVNAAANAGVERFLLCSSQAAAGPASNRHRRKASDVPQPITDYGKSKLAGEESLKENAGDMWWCIVRPPAVYGPHDYAFLPLIRGINRGVKLRFAGESRFSMIYVDDLAQALILSLSTAHDSGAVWFATDGEDHDADGLTHAVENALNKKALRVTVPLWAAYAVSAALSIGGHITGKPVFLSRQKIKELTQDNYTCDDEPLRKTTGYSPEFDLKTGMRDTVTWYKQQGLI